MEEQGLVGKAHISYDLGIDLHFILVTSWIKNINSYKWKMLDNKRVLKLLNLFVFNIAVFKQFSLKGTSSLMGNLGKKTSRNIIKCFIKPRVYYLRTR